MRSVPLVLAFCASLALVSPAATVVFDFGDGGQITASPVNNVTVVSGGVQSAVTGALDSTGSATAISLNTSGFNGANLNGTLTPSGSMAAFDVQTVRDSLFGNTVTFSGGIFPFGTLAFSGLDGSGATAYSFEFTASRTGVSDNRETRYTVSGLNSGIGDLNAAANVSENVVVGGIIPLADGSVTVDVRGGPNNNNSSGFYYLGGLRLVSSPVPEAGSVTLAALGMLGLLARRRR